MSSVLMSTLAALLAIFGLKGYQERSKAIKLRSQGLVSILYIECPLGFVVER